MAELDQEARALYALPLEDFTKARDSLAKQLKSAGKGDRAKRVKALKRPTVAAWTVNQLARSQSESIGKLQEIVEEMGGETSAARIRSLTDERKKLIAVLTEKAEQILESSGHGPGTQTLGQVTQTLTAATSEEDLFALRQGMLTRPLEASGFGLAFGSEEELEEPDDDRESELESLRTQLTAVTEDLEARREEREQAEAKIAELRTDLEAAEAAVKTARREIEDLEKRQRDLKKELEG